MTDNPTSLAGLEEGSDEFQRALTPDERRALEQQLNEQDQEQSEANNEMLDRVTQTPSAVIHHAHIELPENRESVEKSDADE